ncbi:titin-like, partial [Ylistrum balloti]|uniref:titin-like n=1 Tax=Ylistrum balloti TaxID=509963 RepID=UPI002905B1CB
MSDSLSDITDLSELSPSTTTISTVAVQSGRSKVVLAILRGAEWIRVRVHQMEPDLMDVGSTLEEALQYQREHNEMLAKLKAKEDEVKKILCSADSYVTENPSQADVYSAMADTLSEAWRELNKKLEARSLILEQSVEFHKSAHEFSSKMEQAQGKFSTSVPTHDVETARHLLQQHQEIKTGILEASKSTLNQGHILLTRIREMGMHADLQNRHATTAACYGIEHLLELLQDRRRRLEDIWEQRRIRLEQCFQLCQLDMEVNKVLDWYRTVGSTYLQKSELGDSFHQVQLLQEDHYRFETQAKHIQQTVVRLVRDADQLLRRANMDAEGVRRRLQTVDRECEDFRNKLDTRRKNIMMAASFFDQAETALTKLEQVEVQLNSMDLPRNSTALADRHAQLSNAIVEASTQALREGRILLERVSREDPGADGVRRRMTLLQDRCASLESLCKARRAEAWERSQAYLQFQEHFNSLQTWLTSIGQATLSQHADMGTRLETAEDFLEIHEQLEQDLRDKNAELEALFEAGVNLVKSGDQEAQTAAGKVDTLHKQMQKLHRIVEVRIQLSLVYLSFHKLVQQLTTSMSGLEHILTSETENLHDLTDQAMRHTEEMYTKLSQLYNEVQDKGKLFFQNSSTVTDDSTLNVKESVLTVEKIVAEYSERMNYIKTVWESWQQKVSTSRQFKSQWHQFVQDARKTIDWVLKIENDFFPVIGGDLGTSIETANEFQHRLDEFTPTFESAIEELDKHLSTAELMEMKGDTKGQKDMIVNELVKVRQRFQARIHEYRILIKMTIQFFRNLDQLDKLIEKTEKEYTQSELPSDLSLAESLLEEHKRKQKEVSSLINFTSGEGEKIVVRVRQTDAEAAAQEDVERVLMVTAEYKQRWNQAWEEQEKRLKQNLQICQFNYDLRQIHSEIDDLHHHLQARRGSYGNSLPAARMTSQAFKQFEMTVQLIEKKIDMFTSTAQVMVQDQHYDAIHIGREIDLLKTKWSTFHTSVGNYRMLLDVSITYFTLIEESEQWIREGNTLLINISRRTPECRNPEDAETLARSLNSFMETGKPRQEDRLKHISELAVELYGNEGPTKVHHLFVSNQDLMTSAQQMDAEIAKIHQTLVQAQMAPPVQEDVVPMEVTVTASAAVAKQPPKITLHLRDAEVMEGEKVTLECQVQSELPPEVTWYKDNLPLNSPDYETKFNLGCATLTIEETFSEDTARYTCRFTNEVGVAESSSYLHVRETHQQIIPPDFTRNLKSVDVLESGSFAFECHVTGIPSPTISWYKDDINIDSSPEYVITKINGTCCLKMRKVLRSHNARYTCQANNPGGEASSSARLTVIPLEKPVIHSMSEDVNIPEGKSVKLEIIFSGSPTPEVTWYRNDDRISPSSVYKITIELNRSVLEITEAYTEDSGTYKVTLQNTAGETHRTCQVNVENFYSSAAEEMSIASLEAEPQKPSFMQPLAPAREVMEGSRVRLDCVITGHPEPEVIWFRKDKPVKESKDIQLLFEGDRCTLSIREAYLEDSGLYRCLARNQQGEAESVCKLHVEPLSELSDASCGEVAAPKFTQLLRDLSIPIGHRVCLQCRVTGHPVPDIQWYKDNKLIENSPDYQVTAFADVHNLTIPETFEEDTGNYMVRATNLAGEAKCYAKLSVKAPTQPIQEAEVMRIRRVVETKESNMIVKREDGLEQSPPEFQKLFQDMTVNAGDNVTFECVITGSPKPKVTWYFNGEPVVSRDYQISMESSKYRLHIPEVFDEDAGRFSITAENPSGKATCSACLNVDEEPTIPKTRIFGNTEMLSKRVSRTETTTTETHVKHIFESTQRDTYIPSYESHSTTILTDVSDAEPVPMIGATEHYATTLKTDVPPTFKPVDLTIAVPIPPKFLQPLKNITAAEGSKVVFEGVVSGKPQPTIKWFREGKQLTDKADFEIGYRDGRVSLTIPEVFEEDAGRFECQADNEGGQATSSSQLVVRATMIPPMFTEKLKITECREGQAVRFRVRVSGQPPPTVTWYREGAQVVSSPDFEIITEGDLHTLYIPEVFQEDGGNFTVTAENPAGHAQCTTELRILAPMDQTPAPVHKPVIGVKETFDQMRAPPREAPKPFEPTEEPSAKVPKLQRPSQFVKRPEPKPKMFTEKVEVPVESKPQFAPFEKRIPLFKEPAPEEDVPPPLPLSKPPVFVTTKEKPSFTQTLKNISACEGERVVFECRISAHPEPIIKWFRETIVISSSPDYEITWENNTARLTIAEIFPEDSGVFKCVATNAEGCAISEARLEVKPATPEKDVPIREEPVQQMKAPKREEKAPMVTPIRPQFTDKPGNSRLVEATNTIFECHVTGVPFPEITWKKRGFPMRTDNRHRMTVDTLSGRCSLTISHCRPDDAGEYTCTAVNLAGEDTVTATLLPAEVRAPSPPPPPIPSIPVAPLKSWQPVSAEPKEKYVPVQEPVTRKPWEPVQVQKPQPAPQKTWEPPMTELRARMEAPQRQPQEFVVTRAEKILESNLQYRQSKEPEKKKQPPVQDFQSVGFEQRLMSENYMRDGHIKISSETETSEYESELQDDRGPPAPPASPAIIQKLKDFRLIEGSDATFVCRVTGRPRPKIAWYKNGHRIKRSNRYEMKYTKDGYCTLRIRIALPEDAGHFTILAVNAAGKATCSSMLYVDGVGQIDSTSFVAPTTLEKMTKDKTKAQKPEDQSGILEALLRPTFKKVPESLQAREGQTVRLDTVVSGRPAPELTWYRDGQPVRNDMNHKTVVNEDGVNSLIILSASRYDAGTYMCVAKSKAGENSFNVIVSILEKEMLQPPKFQNRIPNITAKAGEPITLTCDVTGTPTPMISWQKDGKMLIPSSPYRIDIEGNRSTLYIERCEPADSAWFQCSAVNVAGSATTRAKVVVPAEMPKPEPMKKFTIPKVSSPPHVATKPSQVVPKVAPQEQAKAPPARMPGSQSPPHYDIQSEGLVQQISYSTEAGSALMRLIKEEDASRIVTKAHITPAHPPMVPMATPEAAPPTAEEPMEEEETVLPQNVADAKRRFETPEKSLPPVGKPPKAPIKHVASPKPVAPHKPSPKPVAQEPMFRPETVKRDEVPPTQSPVRHVQPPTPSPVRHVQPPSPSPVRHVQPPSPSPVRHVQAPRAKEPSPMDVLPIPPGVPGAYDIQSEGPVQMITYVSDTEAGYLRLVSEDELDSSRSRSVSMERPRLPMPKPRTLTVLSSTEEEYDRYDDRPKHEPQLPASLQTKYKQFRPVKPPQQRKKKKSKTPSPPKEQPPAPAVVPQQAPKPPQVAPAPPQVAPPPFVPQEVQKLPKVAMFEPRKEKVAPKVSPKPQGRSPPMVSPVATQIDIPVSGTPAPVEFYVPKGQEASSSLELTKMVMVPSDSEKEKSEATITIKQAVLRRGQPPVPAARIVRKTSEPPKDKLIIEVKEQQLHDPAPVRQREPVRAPTVPKAATTVRESQDREYWSPERKDVIKVKETIEATWDRVFAAENFCYRDYLGVIGGAPDLLSLVRIEDQDSAVREYIRREGEAPAQEDIYDKHKPKKPWFKTQIRNLMGLKENDSAHFECKLLPLGDPTMEIEWFKDGQPLHHGHRYKPMHDFGFVCLDILYTYPEDSGEYSCTARNSQGEATTTAVLRCRGRRSIIMETQLPGEGAMRLQEMEEYWRSNMYLEERIIDEPRERFPPSIDLKPEPVETGEGEVAKFMIKVSGYPRPRVNWWVNGTVIMGSTRFKLRYDGMIHHLEIPRVREYDAGQIRVVAKNTEGEAEASTTLHVMPKEDWRSHLRQAPKGELEIELERRRKIEMRSVELVSAMERPKATTIELKQIERAAEKRVVMRQEKEVMNAEQLYLSVQSKPTMRELPARVVRADRPEIQVDIQKARMVPVIPEQGAPDESKISESQIILERREPPVFTKPLRPVRVTEGNPITLEVHFKGYPPPIISWYRDSFEIKPSHDFQISVTETVSTLFIPEVFPEDTGMYMVKAYNMYGTVQCKAKMTVIEEESPERDIPPEFRSLIRDSNVVEGEPATFDCQVSGRPKPKIHWQKDGKTLSESPRWKFIEEDNNFTMVIYEVTPEDIGQYDCVAINTVGKATCTARLNVEIPVKAPEAEEQKQVEAPVEPPVVTEAPQNLEVDEGEPVTFTSRITGSPPPNVTWYRNNVLIKPSKYFRMESTPDGTHSLSILEAFPEDTGNYRCVARNKAGEVTCSATLKVHALESEAEAPVPAQKDTPPSFTKPISNTLVVEGSPATFEAEYSGTPEPTITWLRNSLQVLQDSTNYKIERTSTKTILTIREARPEDSGLITCRIKNVAGTTECSAELYVQDTEEARLLEEKYITTIKTTPPEFVKALSPVQEIQPGGTARLYASINAYPPPKYQWFTKGVQIVPSERRQMVQEDDTIILIIINVQEEDSGDYILKVENEMGEVTCRTTLTVRGKQQYQVSMPPADTETLTIKETTTMVTREERYVTEMIKPEMIEALEPEIYVRERGIAKLQCKVDSYPPPLVTWFVNGMEIRPSPHYEMTTEEGNSVLLIIEVGPEDTGEYTCRAVSELGEVMSSTTLYVEEPLTKELPVLPKKPEEKISLEPSPSEELMPPRFVEVLPSMETYDGDEVKIPCKVVGKPPPQISFFHNGKNIDHDEEYVVSYNPDTGDIHLLIVEVFPEDEGEYVCVASNPAGEASTRAYLTVLSPEDSVDAAPMETEVVAQYIERPKLEPLVKEEPPASPPPEKPVKMEVTEERKSEEPMEEVLEEVMEQMTKPQIIEREKKVPLEPERAPESPERVVKVTVEHKPAPKTEETRTEICEATLLPQAVTRKFELPDVAGKPVDEEVSKEDSLIGEEKPPQKEEVVSQFTLEEAQEVTEIPPEFVELLEPQMIPDGEEVTMTCRVEGTPFPTVTWYRERQEIIPSADFKITTDDTTGVCTLYIPEVFPEDAGEYACRAVNPFGEAVTTATLLVHTMPEEPEKEDVEVIEEKYVTKIEKSPEFVRPLNPVFDVEEDQTARLEVEVVGEPRPKVTWYVNEVRLMPTPRIQIIDERTTSTLVIMKVVPSDSQDYICVAENDRGVVTCKTTLHVTPKKKVEFALPREERPKQSKPETVKYPVSEDETGPSASEDELPEEMRVPPVFTQLLQPKIVRDGERVEFLVHFRGIPQPKVKWFHDGHELKPSTDFQITVNFNTGESTLVIVEVFPEDEGEYTCSARNRYGETITTCRLTVVAYEYVPDTEEASDSFLSSIEAASPKPHIDSDSEISTVAKEFEEQIQKVKEKMEIEILEAKEEPAQSQEVEIQAGTVETTEVEETEEVAPITQEPQPEEAKPLDVTTEAVQPTAMAPVASVTETTQEVAPASEEVVSITQEPQPEEAKPADVTESVIETTQEVAPSSEEVAPITQEPQVEETKPADVTESVIETTQEVAPSSEEVAPITQEPQPEEAKPAEAVQPIAVEPVETPTTQEVVPSSEEVAPTIQDEEPTGEDVVPFTQESQPEQTIPLEITTESDLEMDSVQILTETTEKEIEISEVSEVPAPKQEVPVFVTPLSDMQVAKGTSVRFEVSFTGTPTPEVAWILEKEELLPSQDIEITIQEHHSVLVLHEVLPKDEGQYIVEVTNPVGKATTTAYLQVTDVVVKPAEKQESPTQEVSIEEEVLSPEETVEVKVTPEDTTKPSEVPSEAAEIEVVIPGVSETTTQEVTEISEVTEVISTVIKEEDVPTFVSKLNDMHVTENTTIRFDVTYTGKPEKVTWFLDGEEIEPCKEIEIVTKEHHSVLLFHDVMLEDEGEYTVEVVSKEGTITSTAYLHVHDVVMKPAEKQEAPIQEASIEEEVLSPEETVEVKVTPEDTTEPSEIPSEAAEIEVVIPGVSETTTQEVTEISEVTEVISTVIKEEDVPTFVSKLNDMHVTENTTIRFDVTYTGKPEKVTWFLDGEEIEPCKEIEIVTKEHHSVLLFHDVMLEDEGEYTVEVVSKEGTITSTAYLHVHDISMKPVEPSSAPTVEESLEPEETEDVSVATEETTTSSDITIEVGTAVVETKRESKVPTMEETLPEEETKALDSVPSEEPATSEIEVVGTTPEKETPQETKTAPDEEILPEEETVVLDVVKPEEPATTEIEVVEVIPEKETPEETKTAIDEEILPEEETGVLDVVKPEEPATTEIEVVEVIPEKEAPEETKTAIDEEILPEEETGVLDVVKPEEPATTEIEVVEVIPEKEVPEETKTAPEEEILPEEETVVLDVVKPEEPATTEIEVVEVIPEKEVPEETKTAPDEEIMPEEETVVLDVVKPEEPATTEIEVVEVIPEKEAPEESKTATDEEILPEEETGVLDVVKPEEPAATEIEVVEVIPEKEVPEETTTAPDEEIMPEEETVVLDVAEPEEPATTEIEVVEVIPEKEVPEETKTAPDEEIMPEEETVVLDVAEPEKPASTEIEVVEVIPEKETPEETKAGTDEEILPEEKTGVLDVVEPEEPATTEIEVVEVIPEKEAPEETTTAPDEEILPEEETVVLDVVKPEEPATTEIEVVEVIPAKETPEETKTAPDEEILPEEETVVLDVVKPEAPATTEIEVVEVIPEKETPEETKTAPDEEILPEEETVVLDVVKPEEPATTEIEVVEVIPEKETPEETKTAPDEETLPEEETVVLDVVKPEEPATTEIEVVEVIPEKETPEETKAAPDEEILPEEETETVDSLLPEEPKTLNVEVTEATPSKEAPKETKTVSAEDTIPQEDVSIVTEIEEEKTTPSEIEVIEIKPIKTTTEQTKVTLHEETVEKTEVTKVEVPFVQETVPVEIEVQVSKATTDTIVTKTEIVKEAIQTVEIEMVPEEKPETETTVQVQEISFEVAKKVETVETEEVQSPRFTTSLTDITIMENNVLHLEVVFTACPAPKVTWFLDGEPLKQSEDIEIIVTETSSAFIIKDAYPEDEGEYWVELTNKAGTARSTAYICVLPRSAPSSEAQETDEESFFKETLEVVPKSPITIQELEEEESLPEEKTAEVTEMSIPVKEDLPEVVEETIVTTQKEVAPKPQMSELELEFTPVETPVEQIEIEEEKPVIIKKKPEKTEISVPVDVKEIKEETIVRTEKVIDSKPQVTEVEIDITPEETVTTSEVTEITKITEETFTESVSIVPEEKPASELSEVTLDVIDKQPEVVEVEVTAPETVTETVFRERIEVSQTVEDVSEIKSEPIVEFPEEEVIVKTEKEITPKPQMSELELEFTPVETPVEQIEIEEEKPVIIKKKPEKTEISVPIDVEEIKEETIVRTEKVIDSKPQVTEVEIDITPEESTTEIKKTITEVTEESVIESVITISEDLADVPSEVSEITLDVDEQPDIVEVEVAAPESVTETTFRETLQIVKKEDETPLDITPEEKFKETLELASKPQTTEVEVEFTPVLKEEILVTDVSQE